MQNNTEEFSWKRGKDKSQKLKKYLLQESLLSIFVFIFPSKDALKSLFIALTDHIG